MNAAALRALDFQAVLDGVASRATSVQGGERIRGLRPTAELEAAAEELATVAETMGFLERFPDATPPPIPDARRALRRLSREGSPLEGGELFTVGLLLRAARLLATLLDASSAPWPRVAAVRPELHPDPRMEEEIARTVEADGGLLDTASPELRRIRAELRRAHARMVAQLETFMRGLPERFRVPDASISVREGRYVIPLRREGKGEVSGGIIHGESATGGTLFVEPPLAIRLMGELHEMERAEAREVARILGEFTQRLLPRFEALRGSSQALVRYDTLHARARLALEWRAHPPTLHPAGSGELRIVQGRHPLLLLRGEGRVVPFDLDLEAGERVMVVSGPNTGGKSVLLKALGLIPALAQSGVIPPVGEGTHLPIFRELFADIGDGQSIAENLSTFSAHLVRLREVVQGARSTSLVLIDEMGTGTDPREGGALARAILEELVRRRALAVATSHLGDLKTLDAPGSGIVNASLQFDPDRIEPTYQLLKGRPGRSYGLAIAGRLGFPRHLLEAARSFMAREEVSVEDLLSSLERREKEVSELQAALAAQRGELGRREGELREREREMAERERTAARRASEEAARLLLQAREEVEQAIAAVRGARAEEVEAEARQSRRRVEEAAARARAGAKAKAKAPARTEPPSPGEEAGGRLAPGDRVRFRKGGGVGVLLEIRDGRAVVESSGMRLQMRLSELVRAAREDVQRAAREAAAPRGRTGWTEPGPAPSWEVHLRGLRMDEMETQLERALDAAILGDLPELRIVHGKGTGALRTRVHDILRGDPRVVDFRMGGTGEGGFGVTVARLVG